MKFLKSISGAFSAALILGTLSIGFVPVVHAIPTYDASALFMVTLDDVRKAGGTETVHSGWSVDAAGFGSANLTESGVADANGSVSVFGSYSPLGIGESINHSSTSFGSASNGEADTIADTDFFVDLFNSTATDNLIFSFSWSLDLDVLVADGATAVAYADILGESGIPDILETLSDTNPGSLALSGTFDISLRALQGTYFDGYVGTEGHAEATAVPEPAVALLIGSGLIGFMVAARRRRS